MQKHTESNPARRIEQFADTVAESDEFAEVVPQDYNPADKQTFICMAWNPTQDGREQITKLQQKVTGVDKRFAGIDVDYANISRGYVKFEAEL